MKQWLARWRAGREARAAQRRAIPDDLWDLTLARLPFIASRPSEDLARLRTLTSLFLDEKEFAGAGGLAVDDAMAVCIGVQACLPVLNFGLEPYRSFVGIVVHPDEVLARREVMDEDGVVHAYDEVLTGEAMEGGPVMLSWRDVSEAGSFAEWGYNVVIHEFAHVLDMGDGAADGVPPLPDALARNAWVEVIEAEFQRLCDEVDAGNETLLDPYGATSVDEFFAVAVESFFVMPHEMRAEHLALYEMLARYFRQDPART
ncbi:MAG: zinc-dependent peptidase [Burkholderiales bacterium]|nr:zinc-dependent peptidase [Burkholderiales bacterium]